MKVAVVEKDKTFGGTCLNVGCIPSKAMLHASEMFDEAAHMFERMGIKVGQPKLDLAAMMKFKDEGVDGNVKGVAYLFKKNKIDTFQGVGRVAAPGKVEVKGDGKAEMLDTKAIVIATGSDVARLRGIDIDEQAHRVVHRRAGARQGSSTPARGRRRRDRARARLGVAPARRAGDGGRVPRPHPARDGQRSRPAMPAHPSRSRASRSSCRRRSRRSTHRARHSRRSVEPAAGGATETIEADVVLVSIGRVPFTEGLGLEGVGVKTDNKGRVIVDGHYATNVPGIYAIGDVIAGPMLAHKAEDEGVAVAEIIAGQAGHVNYDVIPNVVYTFPEIASVGKSEEELKAAGIAYSAGKFPFTANGRAKVNHQTDGFVKILADAKTDRVLGVHIVGADAGNMIAEAAVAMEFGASSEDIARTCHAHPTLSEAVKEAALAVAKRSLSM